MAEKVHPAVAGLVTKVGNVLERAMRSAACRKLLVAVSGGADSMCLLHIVAQLAEKLSIDPVVVHVNHGTRPSAAHDQSFVERMATEWGLPVQSYVVHPAGTSEAELRRVRYEAFRCTAESSGTGQLALAHNQDDLVETLLMNLLRGAGLHGFHFPDIQITGKLTLLRPLSQIPRRDILQYLDAHSIEYCTDETNDSTAATRNRIRHVLLPLLEAEFNPSVRDALVRCAAVLSTTDEYLTLQAGHELDRCAKMVRRADVLPVRWLRRRPAALQQRILRMWITQALPDAFVSFEHLKLLIHMLEDGHVRPVMLPGGSAVVCTLRALWLYNANSFEPIDPEQEPSAKLARAHCTLFDSALSEMKEHLHLERATGSVTMLNGRTVIVSTSAAPGFTVRNRLQGDRLAAGGKLKNVLIDDKIPVYVRDYLICVADERNRIVHVFGLDRLNGRIRKKLGRNSPAFHLQRQA
ncbi:MAG: tRNA lysidine(34) synthetase TilS [Candidatus Sumerlaeaceae bacterium]